MSDIRLKAIVTGKTKYGDDSLIITTLSAEKGKIKFIQKHALRQSKRKFPAVDLFREIECFYTNKPKNELQQLRQAELLVAHDSIAQKASHYRAALKITDFLNRNTVTEHDYPHLYKTLLNVLDRLANETVDCLSSQTATVYLSMLYENGSLPDLSLSPDKEKRMLKLLAYGSKQSQKPEYDKAQWQRLERWLIQFMFDTGFNVSKEISDLSD